MWRKSHIYFIQNTNNEFNKTVDKGGIAKALGDATRTFRKDRDIYFRSVDLTSVPGLNAERRLTSVTNIQMEFVEPSGLTLIERLRAAAANNQFLDHTDAPYMLTIEFKGFDEDGKEVMVNTDHTKRVIPIKIMQMAIDVNQGGANYTISAVPYNEFGLVNNFMYPRTSGTLSSVTRTFKEAVQDLQETLNAQNEDERTREYNQYPDRYDISISEDLNPEASLQYELLGQAGMTQKKEVVEPGSEAFTMEYIKFNSATNLLKTLEELMKTHPEYGAKSFEDWSNAVTFNQGVRSNDPNSAIKSYFKYFRIRTSVEPTTKFDEIRQTNAKIINIVVEPFYISAYNLATAGIHQDKKYQTYVAKAYNYIFTGDNLDIQDLNINYKVAYFQSKLKDLEASESRTFTQDNEMQEKKSVSPLNKKKWGPFDYLPLKSEPSVYKSSNSNRAGKGDAKVDQFFDAITNPQADMVIVDMNILGDPAWLGQSQFIPATPSRNTGSSKDNNIDFFRGGKSDNVWNPELKCFNYDVAEPVTNLTFKVPQDFNDQEGVYDMSAAQQAVFSGLYKVVKVQHKFVDGTFQQTLTMVRFNNQDSSVTPTQNSVLEVKNGVVVGVKNPIQMARDNGFIAKDTSPAPWNSWYTGSQGRGSS